MVHRAPAKTQHGMGNIIERCVGLAFTNEITINTIEASSGSRTDRFARELFSRNDLNVQNIWQLPGFSQACRQPKSDVSSTDPKPLHPMVSLYWALTATSKAFM